MQIVVYGLDVEENDGVEAINPYTLKNHHVTKEVFYNSNKIIVN